MTTKKLIKPTAFVLLVFGFCLLLQGGFLSNNAPQTENSGSSNSSDNPDESHSSQSSSSASAENTPDNSKILSSSEPKQTKQAHFVEGVAVNEDQTITKHGKVYPLRTYETLAIPNDPYANQWWIAPTGMSNAWSVPAGPRQVAIAIIDTGFALSHQEFSGRWATNSGESGILASNGIDDDNNGFIDDWRGWDFSNNDNNPQAGETNPDGEGTTHGTMTAGILGATGNNGAGIAGVNWQAKILPMQALDDNSYGNTLTVANSIYYAVDQGVDIISISLGTAFEDPYLREAILYAQEHNVLIVAASGNDGCNCMSYPANYPEVVAVGASNSANNVASFSSWGTNLDLVAPGQEMTSSYWTKTNGTSTYASNIAGTSFSTPFVAGLIGLVRSHQTTASWDEITGSLYENSDRHGLTMFSPKSASFGFGFARADTALTRAYNPYASLINYYFAGEILGSERIKKCEGSTIPASYLYELSKSGQVRYTINQYEIRKAALGGWTTRQLFAVCVALPTDLSETLRSINLNQEIRNQLIKQ